MVSCWTSLCLSVVRLSCTVRLSICFSFPDDNLRKHQWIFTKLGMCIDIVEIWFGITTGQILSKFDGVTCPYFCFPDDNFSKCQGILTKLRSCIDMKEI